MRLVSALPTSHAANVRSSKLVEIVEDLMTIG